MLFMAQAINNKKSYGYLESGYSDSGYHIGNLVNKIWLF